MVYDLLMKAAAETTLAIAGDEKRLGARVGITSVLHTWGSAMTHHPHVHMIVSGGGLAPARGVEGNGPTGKQESTRWISKFRGKLLAMLMDAHDAGELKFFNTHSGLADRATFKRFLGPLRHITWVVYCKAPFAGPEAVLRYLSRYTHRIAISNRRLVSAEDGGIAFRWKDYREDGLARWKTMTLSPGEFIRRFLIHVLPKGFHRIRHYGLLANGHRAESLAKARELLSVRPRVVEPEEDKADQPDEPRVAPCPCPRCGARMLIIEVFARGCEPRWRPAPASHAIRIETS